MNELVLSIDVLNYKSNYNIKKGTAKLEKKKWRSMTLNLFDNVELQPSSLIHIPVLYNKSAPIINALYGTGDFEYKVNNTGIIADIDVRNARQVLLFSNKFHKRISTYVRLTCYDLSLPASLPSAAVVVMVAASSSETALIVLPPTWVRTSAAFMCNRSFAL